MSIPYFPISDENIAIAQTTGDTTATMQYARYEEDIIHKRGVKLVGWTYDKIVNPSQLSSALKPLSTLRNALRDGTCKFVCLSPQEVKQRVAAYHDKVRCGQLPVRKRKPRKDKGTVRHKISQAVVDDDSSGNEGAPSKKQRLDSGNSDTDASSSD